MSQLGAWGTALAFESSSNRLLTPCEIGVEGSARYAQHDVVGLPPFYEFIGPGLSTCQLTVRLSAREGVSPRAQLDLLRAARDEGVAAVLVIGGRPVFDAGHLAVLEKIGEAWAYFTGQGGLLVAVGELTFHEVVPREHYTVAANAIGSGAATKRNVVSK